MQWPNRFIRNRSVNDETLRSLPKIIGVCAASFPLVPDGAVVGCGGTLHYALDTGRSTREQW
ncbi:MAG: hypothetical protein J7449_04570 [Thermomicrobium sp.]|uniref:hypothetical protein n=1 Tax=Thermomicrobium sp. TaxID=1969469 RepID=UPI001B22F7A5|nr:hypothetical protein [Thermomicrobium sp.]MBO9350732.1 hypothetical protein [Thermomicrobium sp.]